MALLNPRRVSAARGFQWIRQGASLVLLSPIGWISTLSLWLMVVVVAIYFPTLGPILFSLSLPGIFAGFMLGCHAIESERSLKARHLLKAFQHNPRYLFQLGLINILVETLLSLILITWGGQSIADLQQPLASTGTTQLEQAQITLASLSPVMLGLLLLQLFMLMTSWFSPALLMFTSLSTLQALNESTRACLRNLPAFGMFTLTMAMLLALGSWIALVIPLLSLPIGFYLLALIIASVYASYRDVFPDIIPNRSSP